MRINEDPTPASECLGADSDVPDRDVSLGRIVGLLTYFDNEFLAELGYRLELEVFGESKREPRRRAPLPRPPLRYHAAGRSPA